MGFGKKRLTRGKQGEKCVNDFYFLGSGNIDLANSPKPGSVATWNNKFDPEAATKVPPKGGFYVGKSSSNSPFDKVGYNFDGVEKKQLCGTDLLPAGGTATLTSLRTDEGGRINTVGDFFSVPGTCQQDNDTSKECEKRFTQYKKGLKCVNAESTNTFAKFCFKGN